MTTQTKAREAIQSMSAIFVKEVLPLGMKELEIWVKKSAPVFSTIWFYTRWTLVAYSTYAAIDILNLIVGEAGVLGVFPGSSYESLASSGRDVLYLGLAMAWLCVLGLVSAPYLSHYLLIRRPDVPINFLKKGLHITEE